MSILCFLHERLAGPDDVCISRHPYSPYHYMLHYSLSSGRSPLLILLWWGHLILILVGREKVKVQVEAQQL